MSNLKTFSDVMDTLPMEELRDILLHPRVVSPNTFTCMAAWLGTNEAPIGCEMDRVMVICGAFPTLSEARRKLHQGGIKWNGEPVRDHQSIPTWLWPGWGILALGKKQHWLVVGKKHEQTTEETRSGT
jgi:tyrosyl-tRNA synthetase